MIGTLIAFFGTFLGRASMVAALVASVVAWRAWDISEQRSIGETRAEVKMEKRADANAKKADAAARTVDALPASGLRDRYRRD